MTFNISQSYSFVRQFNAKDETKESVAFAEGKLVIDENKIIFTDKDTKGNSYNIAYEGNYTNMIDDTSTENHWKYEPKTPTTKTENFTSATFTDYKDYFQNGTKYLYCFCIIWIRIVETAEKPHGEDLRNHGHQYAGAARSG